MTAPRTGSKCVGGRSLRRTVGALRTSLSIKGLPDQALSLAVAFGPALLILAILALAAFLRLKELADIPPALHIDEASQGINGLAVIEGDASPLRLGFTHHLNTAFLLNGVVLKSFGVTVWNLRIPEVVAGIGAVLLTYLLGRSMFSWRVGLVAALLLSVNHFAIAFSRIGLVNQQAMTVEILAFYLLWKGFREERRLFAFLGGAAVAVGLYLYFGGWVVPLILGAFGALMLAVHRRRALRYWRLGGWGVAGFLIFMAPWLSFPILNSDEFHQRPNEVFIFSDLDHYKEYWHTDSTTTVLRQQTVNTIKFVYEGGDTSNQYGYDDPFFDPIAFWLFAIGAAIALALIWRGPYGFLVIWFVGTLVIGGILTDTPPFMPRLVGLFPAAVLLAAVGLVKPFELLVTRVPASRRVVVLAGLPVAVVLLGVFSFHWNYRAYFQEYPVAPYTIYWPWIEPHSSTGRYLESLPEGSQAYLFRTGHIYASQPIIQFFIYDDEVVLEEVDCREGGCQIPPPVDDALTAYLFVPEAMDFKALVERQYPGGVSRTFSGHSDFSGDVGLQFVAYEVRDPGQEPLGIGGEIGNLQAYGRATTAESRAPGVR